MHAYTPTAEEHGWRSTHTIVEVVSDDMPFIVDSVSMALTRGGRGIHRFLHPAVRVRRDADGRLVDLLRWEDDGPAESLLHVEIDRQTERSQLDELEADLQRVLSDVRAAVDDWPAMRARVRDAVALLDERPPPLDPDEVAEARALLAWIGDDHFTFLGYREYELQRDGDDDVLASVPGSGLGILRETEQKPVSRSFSRLPPEVRRLARQPTLLNLTKANSRATVHRPAYLDYVGLKQIDEDGRGVERASLHRALHAHRLPREPVGDTGPAPQGAARRRAQRVRGGRSRSQGAGRDPRDIPARRALPDR